MSLYREEIIERYKFPRYRGMVQNPHTQGEVANALCGDELTLFLRLDAKKEKAAEMKFQGEGCALMTAAADMLCEAGTGKSIENLRRFSADDMLALYGEPPSPARLTCALLPYEALKQALATEKNPGIQAVALRALGPYAKPEVRDLLVKYLNTSSYRDRLTEAAISGMKAQDDPAFVAPLLATLSAREATLPSTVFSVGLDALASLSRNEPKKDSIRDFLISRVNSPKERVRLSAINALGTLEDPRAIAALETFTSLAADRPEKAAAEKALVQLRTARKPGEELKGLRTEVLDLQKSNRELKKDLETLKKKLEAK